ncbi:MAG: anaerobic ribonucleoside-triphosphate reductase, partial [Candidatus Aenigmarchaeota archaeon]|nr:anaerobic ribonucleoside-triphosphate reductase [Candidatus Aenigmarchaeota archaeon]
LRQETKLDRKESEKIAISVERKILSSNIKRISINQIRLLVDAELFTRNCNTQLKKSELLGMSTYNLNQLIFSKSNENSNIVFNNPEAVNLSIAENTLKQYALKEIFSKDVSDAHLNAIIHLHDLGYPIRAYCSAHSLEYIKKYGLSLVNLSTESSPANHAQTLTGHLNTFLASMQAYYAGALGIGFVNIFYAPYLVGVDDKRLKQEAQYLIFSCSQNAFSRGGQTIFMDFNIHLGIPNYLKNVPAIGPGGKYTGKTYGDYELEAQRFGKALMEVWKEGDKNGLPFPFPKFDLHINQDSFDDPSQRELLRYACKIASDNGSPYFIFDRDEINLSMCCRLRTKVTDMSMIEHPEKLRFCGFQIVTVNLPQAAYRAKGDLDKTVREIEKAMDLCMKAHLQKKKFTAKIMECPGTPMWQVGKVSHDGTPYIDLDKATYLIGMVGLNECVKRLTGQPLHESDDAYKVGLKVVSAMYLKAKQLEKEHNLKITLEETPAESTSFRFAKVDLQKFEEAKDYVRGDQKSGEIYYTNSVHLEADAPVDIVDRIEMQARFNNLIESGAITHVFLGEQRPDPESIYQLVKKTWDNTQSAQIVISPEFTVCEDCGKITPGFMRENTTIDISDKV